MWFDLYARCSRLSCQNENSWSTMRTIHKTSRVRHSICCCCCCYEMRRIATRFWWIHSNRNSIWKPWMWVCHHTFPRAFLIIHRFAVIIVHLTRASESNSLSTNIATQTQNRKTKSLTFDSERFILVISKFNPSHCAFKGITFSFAATSMR